MNEDIQIIRRFVKQNVGGQAALDALERLEARFAHAACSVCGWNGGGIRDEGCMLKDCKCPRFALSDTSQLRQSQGE